jgi:hypothetical protein
MSPVYKHIFRVPASALIDDSSRHPPQGLGSDLRKSARLKSFRSENDRY